MHLMIAYHWEVGWGPSEEDQKLQCKLQETENFVKFILVPLAPGTVPGTY